MRLLDEEFSAHNFKGILGLRDHLRLAGHAVNSKRMRLMGHEVVCPAWPGCYDPSKSAAGLTSPGPE